MKASELRNSLRRLAEGTNNANAGDPSTIYGVMMLQTLTHVGILEELEKLNNTLNTTQQKSAPQESAPSEWDPSAFNPFSDD